MAVFLSLQAKKSFVSRAKKQGKSSLFQSYTSHCGGSVCFSYPLNLCRLLRRERSFGGFLRLQCVSLLLKLRPGYEAAILPLSDFSRKLLGVIEKVGQFPHEPPRHDPDQKYDETVSPARNGQQFPLPKSSMPMSGNDFRRHLPGFNRPRFKAASDVAKIRFRRAGAKHRCGYARAGQFFSQRFGER